MWTKIALICLLSALIVPSAQARRGYEPGPGGQQSAFYWVPVSTELSPYAGFRIDDFEMEVEAGRTKVEYSLPLHLVGVSHKLHFYGPIEPDAEGNLVLTGENGRLVCRVSAAQCHAKYENLPFNQEGASRYIREISASEAEAKARELVFTAFSTEGVGFLLFRK